MTTYAEAKAALQSALSSAQPAGAIYPERLATVIIAVTDALSSTDRYVTSLASYNSTTNALVLNMSDGSTVSIDMTSLIADAVSDRVITTRAVATAVGLAGGGNLTADRTIALDINSLTEDVSPALSTDYVLTWDVSASSHKKVKPSNLIGSGVSWGAIVGTLSSQTDLQTALNAKAVVASNNYFSADQTINKGSPRLNFDKTASGQDASIIAYKSSILRWHMQLGSETAEGGANSGSDFALHRFSDAGAYLGTAMTIYRANGAVAFPGVLTASGRITSGADFYANGSGATAYHFDDRSGSGYCSIYGSSGNAGLYFSGTNALVQFSYDRSYQYITDSGGTARQILHAGNVSTYVTFGYLAGDGGTVTQITSATTGVTLNKKSGKITTVSQSITDSASVSFTFSNSQIAANDVVVISHDLSPASGLIVCHGLGSGSRTITIKNLTASTISGVLNIAFNVSKVATS
jgi:hypothetical protein